MEFPRPRQWRFLDPEYDMRLRPLVNFYVRKLSSFILLGILLFQCLGAGGPNSSLRSPVQARSHSW